MSFETDALVARFGAVWEVSVSPLDLFLITTPPFGCKRIVEMSARVDLSFEFLDVLCARFSEAFAIGVILDVVIGVLAVSWTVTLGSATF